MSFSTSTSSVLLLLTAGTAATLSILYIHYRLETVEKLVFFPLKKEFRSHETFAQVERSKADDKRVEEKAKEEEDDQEREGRLESRIGTIETELHVLKRVLANVLESNRQQHIPDAEYVTIDASKVGGGQHGNNSKSYNEVSNWTCQQTKEWVEKVLGKQSTAVPLFATINGASLLGMLLDDEHGFSFGDKCFFMGVKRGECTVLERASIELLKR